jgi:hypothetical protein
MLDNHENTEGHGPKDVTNANGHLDASAVFGGQAQLEKIIEIEQASHESQENFSFKATTSNHEGDNPHLSANTINTSDTHRTDYLKQNSNPTDDIEHTDSRLKYISTRKEPEYLEDDIITNVTIKKVEIAQASKAPKPEKIDLVHKVFRSIVSTVSNGFNQAAVWSSETFLAANPTGRLACVGSVVLGSAIPPLVYTQNIFLGLLVTAGALTAAIAASTVNRSLAYDPDLKDEEVIKKFTQKQDLAHYRESLLITGVVAGPAAFWAAFSPILSQLRESLISQLDKVPSLPSFVVQTADYASSRGEHLIPFLLISALTTIAISADNSKHFVNKMGLAAGQLSPLFGWWGEFREWVGKEFKDEAVNQSEDAKRQPERIGLVHSAFRSICHGFNTAAVSCSEFVFTGNPVGRVACVALTAFGWAIPPEVYTHQYSLITSLLNPLKGITPVVDAFVGGMAPQLDSLIGPCLGVFVASAALSGAIAASAVNRAIHYNELWISEDGIAWSVGKFGIKRFRESLSVAGSIIGPASFWAAISPVLTQARHFTISKLDNVESLSSNFVQTLDYVGGRIEHLIPFLLIGAITTMRIVNQKPERFVRSMSPTAGMISAVMANPIYSLKTGIVSVSTNARDRVRDYFTNNENKIIE